MNDGFIARESHANSFNPVKSTHVKKSKRGRMKRGRMIERFTYVE